MKITIHYPTDEVDPNVVDELERYPQYRKPYGPEIYTVEGTISKPSVVGRIQALAPIMSESVTLSLIHI